MADSTISEVTALYLKKGILTEETDQKVREECAQSGKDVQQVIFNLNLASKDEVLQVLSQQWDVPVIDLSAVEIDLEIGKILPKDFCKEKIVCPFSKEEDKVLLAMRDPKDFFAVEDIEMRFGIRVTSYLALSSDISRAISKIYQEGTDEEAVDETQEEVKEQEISQEELSQSALDMTEELLEGLETSGSEMTDLEIGKGTDVEDIMQVDTSAPVVEKLMNAIILEAIRLGASDIHIEPFEKKMVVRYRVDGALRKSTFKVPFTFRNALLAKIKIMGDMNITERRIPQDGRITVKVKGKPYEFRVNIVPTVMGESAVLRILDRSGAKWSLDQLGFLPDTQEKFLSSLMKPYGLILVCGPTGSGKSFTLMAALTAVRDPEDKILTAENPVEYNLDGVVQVQVNPDLSLGDGKKFSFAAALRSFLRQDPDTIMIGEIRDEETGRTACEAAMTGHLVLSTIHTNDSTSVIARLAEMGVAPYLIASTLEAILAQRLVRTLCKSCKEPDTHPSSELLRALEENKLDYKGATFMKQRKCSKCGNKGLKGRTAIHELLVMNEPLRAICKPGIKSDEVRTVAIQSGMRPLLQDGLIKVTKGITTYEEILSAAK